MIRQAFKPAVVVESVLEGNPSLSCKALVRVSRAVIASEEAEDLSASLSALPQQGRMMREFGGKEAAMWATVVGKLPPEPLKFALNATVESLPTNANLHKWGKRPSASCPLCLGSCQSLLHILNDCPKAMFLCHYAIRHDNVLQNISRFIDCHLPPSYCRTVDLPDNIYSFSHHITPTNLRPDVVWWSDEMKRVYFLELTISSDSTMDQAHNRKLAKYYNLLEVARMAGYNAECLAFEVGSRGLVIERELQDLRRALGTTTKEITGLGVSLSQLAILGSFRVWCSRNKSMEYYNLLIILF